MFMILDPGTLFPAKATSSVDGAAIAWQVDDTCV
jgi:hypothetical protein